jgi:hypothetical protein
MSSTAKAVEWPLAPFACRRVGSQDYQQRTMLKCCLAGEQGRLSGCRYPTPSHLAFASEAIPELDVYSRRLPPGALLGVVLKQTITFKLATYCYPRGAGEAQSV